MFAIATTAAIMASFSLIKFIARAHRCASKRVEKGLYWKRLRPIMASCRAPARIDCNGLCYARAGSSRERIESSGCGRRFKAREEV